MDMVGEVVEEDVAVKDGEEDMLKELEEMEEREGGPRRPPTEPGARIPMEVGG